MKGWLARQSGGSGRGFATDVYTEKAGWKSAGAPDIMARLIAEGTASDETVRAVAGAPGWDEERARDALVAKRQPKHESQRMGKFGEILHAGILEEFQGMTVVTQKYRYNPAPDAPVHGADLIAIGAAGDGSGDRVVYAETKLRTVRDGEALVRARAALARVSSQDLPSTLVSELVRLHEADSGMFWRLAAAAVVQKNTHCRIGAVFEESAWSDSYLDRLGRAHGPGGLDMAVDVVKIRALRALVRESYKRVK